MLTVSGINLFHDGNEWSVCLGDRDGVLPPFNGVGDTVFFEISPQTYFVPFELPHAGVDNRYASSYIEIMRKPAQRMLYGGFLWYHLAAMRESILKTSNFIEAIRFRGDNFCAARFLRWTSAVCYLL